MIRRFRMFLLLPVLLLASCDSDDPFEPGGQVPIADLVDGEIALETNPSGIAPLTAELQFRTRSPATVSFRVLGGPGDIPLARGPGEPTSDHALPILGLHADTWNPVEVRVDIAERWALDTIFIATDPLPSFLPDIEVTTSIPERMESGWTLADLGLGLDGTFETHPLMFDETGAVRWYLNLSGFGELWVPFERLENGNLIAGSTELLVEFDMMGNRVHEWIIGPTYTQHHDIDELPDGNLLVAVNKPEVGTVEDHIIEIDRESGEVLREWDLRQIMDVHRTAFVDNPEDWLHVNSIWYDPSDGGIIISARHQGVFKVSGDNELLWILAPHRGWGAAGPDANGLETSNFLLTAVDASGTPYPAAVQDGAERAADFDWAWGQHAAMILPSGNLWLFDNGDYRHFSDASPDYSRGVEYQVDTDAMTVRQVWAYGRERGESYFASFVSDVDYLYATDNRLVLPGIVRTSEPSRAFVTEVASDGTVVFEAQLRFKNELGFLPDLVYRSERLTVYPD